MKTVSKIFWTLVFLGLLGYGGYKGYLYKRDAIAKAAAAKQEIADRNKRPVPVLTAKAIARDVPVWLANPGTVQAYNTVTVRPRVSGTLDTVNFTEGQLVNQGDVLAQIDARPYKAVLDQASARKIQNEALLTNARLELARVKSLVESDAESQRVLDEQAAKTAQLEASVKADQAAIDAAQLDFDFTTLRSPITGRTGIRHVDAGNTVTANQPEGLVVVTQMNPISVVFSLAQKHIASLLPSVTADAAPFKVQALHDRTDDVLGEGVLSLMDNQVDLSTDSIRLKATFPNESGTLWPGQYVNARVHVTTLNAAVLVPSFSVVAGIDGPFVYIAKPDNTVEVRLVETGLVLPKEHLVVITKGIEAGELIIREGQNKLKPSSIIAPIAEGATP